MSKRKHNALKRRVVRLLSDWKDPLQSVALTQSDIIQAIDIAEDGETNLTIKPSRPHCPCCLLDLDSLRKKICEVKGVTFVQFTIVDVPASERWTRVLNR